MNKWMAQNGGEWRSLGGRLLGVDKGRELADSSVALFKPRSIILKVEHDVPGQLSGRCRWMRYQDFSGVVRENVQRFQVKRLFTALSGSKSNWHSGSTTRRIE